MAAPPSHPNRPQGIVVAEIYEEDSDGSSSAPNSETEAVEDDVRRDIELIHLEDADYLEPIPVIIRLTPPIMQGGPPVLEVWGARPFGYLGTTVVWTHFRAEPESDDIPDDASYWAPLGIRVDANEYHRAFLIRPTPETQDHPPPAPVHPDLFYATEQVQPVPGALRVKTFEYEPSRPDMGAGIYPISHFWLTGVGKITDRKDLKRVRMKVDVYVHVVKGRRGPIRYY